MLNFYIHLKGTINQVVQVKYYSDRTIYHVYFTVNHPNRLSCHLVSGVKEILEYWICRLKDEIVSFADFERILPPYDSDHWSIYQLPVKDKHIRGLVQMHSRVQKEIYTASASEAIIHVYPLLSGFPEHNVKLLSPCAL